MDENNTYINKSEKEALEIMENVSDITSDQLQALRENEECFQTCSDIAEAVIGMQMEKNALSINTQQALADFHRKHLDRRNKKLYILWTSVAGVAATIIIILVLRMMSFSPESDIESIKVFQADHAPQQVTLQVAGEEKVEPLKKAVQSLPSSTVKLSPQKIAYNTIQTENKKIRNKKVQIHRLSIPRGETFKVVLSDGTEVLLNSDSRLKYPEVFTGNERKVYLEGEAYFEVAKDKEHPFKVMAQGVEVNVLGTHFNVNAYPERTDVVTTLVEGKVRVGRGTRQIVLVPGEQAAASAESLNVKKVDVREYIAWKDGLFVFSRMSLEEIMRQVYRWYGVETVFSDETVRAVTFTGIIDKSMPLGELFKVIETVVDVRFVMDENNQVVITAK